MTDQPGIKSPRGAEPPWSRRSQFSPGFPDCGGEMARRIRDFDWSKTPVGVVSQWPLSLITAVRILLASRFPMFVWWGRELTNFYNDAYVPMLGHRHPAALGQSAKDTWIDIWDVVGPQTEQVLQIGKSTWNEECLLVMSRYGYKEETYFTFSYSPAPRDDGSVGGVFCAVTEDTQRVLSRRRLRTLRELATHTVAAKTAQEACELSAKALGINPNDLPFALIYLCSPDRKEARLAGASGIEPGQRASPLRISLEQSAEPESLWPLSKVAGGTAGIWLTDLPQRTGLLPGGPWPECPTSAAVLPIAQSGQDQLAGFLVAGISPRRPLDEDYRDFLGLAAGHVATAIANAVVYESEHRRAEALLELDRAKTAFFSNVSHEFRTPLTLMLGPLEEALAEPGVRSSAASANLEMVHRNALRLLKLVNSLLDFSRIDAGRQKAVFEPVDLAACTSELASVFRSAIEKAGLRYVIDCPPLPGPVYIDRELWEKIIFNLLSNALKFTFEGTIGISLRSRPGWVDLVVNDSGVGIPPDEVQRVFERFHRVSGSRARSHEGTGIGLALVQQLARVHGGEVRVDSEIHAGSAFTVSIPTGTAHLPKDQISPARGMPTGTATALPFLAEAANWLPVKIDGELYGPKSPTAASADRPGIFGNPGGRTRARIVLADDNRDMREYVRRLLADRFDVTAVGDGKEALETVLQDPPQLVLADVMMPNLDGFGLLRALRSHPETKAIPVILLSARAGEEARVEGVEAGADDYLTKPFSARELTARVATQIKMARVRQEAAQKIAGLSAELTRRLEEFQTLMRALPVGVFLARDASCSRIEMNAAGAALLRLRDGSNPSETGPDAASLPYRVLQSGVEIAADDLPMQRAARLGVPVLGEEVEIAFADGGAVTLYEHVVPLFDDEGKPRGCVGAFVDITARKKIELELAEARRQLQAHADNLERTVAARTAELREVNEQLEAFVYSIAHDLRAPLRSVAGHTQVLLEDYSPRLDDTAKGLLERLQDSAIFLDRLVLDLLAYGRIARSQLQAEPVRVDIAWQNASFQCAAQIEETGAEIQTVEPLPIVLAHEATLGQCLANLLANALKFVAPGVRPCVRFWAEDRGNVARLSLQDNGIGIPPQHYERAFRVFERLQGSRFPGTGIGLSIVKKSIERLQGRVGLESPPGGGTCVWIELPKAGPPT